MAENKSAESWHVNRMIRENQRAMAQHRHDTQDFEDSADKAKSWHENVKPLIDNRKNG